MRKMLLASAALVGAASLPLTANAQPTGMSMAPTQGQTMTATAGNPPAGANNNNNSAASPRKGAVAVPEPGTVVIHFNGRVLTALTGSWSGVDSVSSATGGVAPGANGAFQAFKQDSVGIRGYARLYSGLDAMSTNGIRYGGAIEVRNNFGAPVGSSSGTNAGSYTNTQTFYLRRAFAYAASDNAGILRAGQADGLISLFDNGVTTFQFLPSGVMNGGDLQANFPGAATVPFANYSVSGNEYGNSKLVYLSPQFMGLDFGIQWAPNTTNQSSIGSCTAAGSGCPNLSSSTIPLDGTRITNQTAIGARYQGSFGQFAFLGYGVYTFSGHTKYNGPPLTYTAARTTNNSAGIGQFANLGFGNVGAAVTVSGVTFGGNYLWGAVNGQGALKPQGGADTSAILAGVKYTQGPLTVGLVGEMIDSQGAAQLTGISQRHEYAIDIGASYTIAPGFVGWVEAVYQHRHQGGFNFAQGSSSSAPGAYNNVKSQGMLIGSTVYW